MGLKQLTKQRFSDFILKRKGIVWRKRGYIFYCWEHKIFLFLEQKNLSALASFFSLSYNNINLDLLYVNDIDCFLNYVI